MTISNSPVVNVSIQMLSPLSRGVLGLIARFPDKPVSEIVSAVMARKLSGIWRGMKRLGVAPGMVHGPFDEYIARAFDPSDFPYEAQYQAVVRLLEFVEGQREEQNGKMTLEIEIW